MHQRITRGKLPTAFLAGFKVIRSSTNKVLRVPQALLELFSTSNKVIPRAGCDPKRSHILHSHRGNEVAVHYRRKSLERLAESTTTEITTQ